jgi:hypothetical protein
MPDHGLIGEPGPPLGAACLVIEVFPPPGTRPHRHRRIPAARRTDAQRSRP